LAERCDVHHRREFRSLDEAGALASSKLGIDENELWTDGLGYQNRAAKVPSSPRETADAVQNFRVISLKEDRRILFISALSWV
jgi:hypothetical protein